jgi:CubicO group peptidase (beta-lactamase class C family)
LSSTAPLAVSGRLYSYSNGGPWLLAAILESLFKTRYADLLHEKLFAVLNTSREHDDPLAGRGLGHGICPSQGGSLTVSAGCLLQFLHYHLPDRSGLFFDASPERVREEVLPLPGWSMVERGVRLAWKYYGEGWFGHDAILPTLSALVRLHPRDSVGLVMAVPGHAAIALAAKLFKGLLPDSGAIAFPRLLTASELAASDMGLHTGIYGSSTVRVVIERGRDFTLQLRAYRRKSNGDVESVPFAATAMRPGVADTFMARSPVPHSFPFVQFITSAEHSIRHLWNGSRVLPRLA